MKDGRRVPRTLVISHNVFSRSTNMGKTLDTYFAGWDRDALAQLYFHSQVPVDPVCVNYFRMTDPDALRSIVLRRHRGEELGEKDVRPERADPADTGSLAGVYNYGRNRTPLIYLLRDGIWALSGWKHSGMAEWAERFRPEVILLASGDYAFPYRITMYLARKLGIPYVVCCYDDYYLFTSNENRFLGRFRQERFMKTVRKTMAGAAKILALNDSMAEAYGKLFGKACGVLYTAAAEAPEAGAEAEKEGIVYLGGLGLNRDLQLMEMADLLREAAGPGVPAQIDVYSGEKDPARVARLKAYPGIRFLGSVPGDKVPGIIRSHRAVIHTESFDPVIRERVRYSLSTKIPECIASGTCLLAYGPADVASIAYLRKNDAAFTASSPEELKAAMRELFGNPERYRAVEANARALARRNHDGEKIREYVRNVLAEAAGNAPGKNGETGKD